MLRKYLDIGEGSLYHDYPFGRLMAEEAKDRNIKEFPRVYHSPRHNRPQKMVGLFLTNRLNT